MSASGTSIFGDSPNANSSFEKTGSKFAFGPALGHSVYYFSLFLVFFPPLSLLLYLHTNGTLLVSMPLALMCICGIFGTRASLQLRKGRDE